MILLSSILKTHVSTLKGRNILLLILSDYLILWTVLKRVTITLVSWILLVCSWEGKGGIRWGKVRSWPEMQEL